MNITGLGLLLRLLNMLDVKDVVTGENGVLALEALKEHKDTIDVVLTDLEMPEMGRYELVRKIRYGLVPE